jgi:hypothetical protein
MRMNSKIDIRSILPTIRVPTLVIHRTGDATIERRWRDLLDNHHATIRRNLARYRGREIKTSVAQLSCLLGRADDVGKENRSQHPVDRHHRARTGQELLDGIGDLGNIVTDKRHVVDSGELEVAGTGDMFGQIASTLNVSPWSRQAGSIPGFSDRSLKLTNFILSQSNSDRVIMVADELG